MNKKNILIIAPKFHGYDVELANELKKRYRNVFLKNELPFNSSTRYFLLEKISPRVRSYMWKKYEENVKKLVIDNKIEVVFVIRGELIPESLLQWLANQPGIEIVHYQWDSVNNNPNALVISKYAHRNYSFDRNDTETYTQFNYLPLFYNWENMGIHKTEKYGIMFFGSWNYDRLEIVKAITEMSETLGLRLYARLYMPFQSYIKRKFQGKSFPWKMLRFCSMPKEQYYNLLLSSDIIFDVPSKTQVGSSMRTIESLSLKKKIITTNLNVKKESFYCSENIIIWPATTEEIRGLLNSKFNERSIENIYSLSQWLDRIGLS